MALTNNAADKEFTLFVVRHGQDTYNLADLLNGHTDTELTGLGREQARIVAQKLKGKNISTIYSSPLKRTQETAQIIAKEIGLADVVADRRLIERDFGVLTGKPRADIPKYAKNLLHTDRVVYFLEADGAESFPSTYGRAQEFLEYVSKNSGGANILAVTHGDTGKMLRAVNEGWDWLKGLKTPYFSNCDAIELLCRKS